MTTLLDFGKFEAIFQKQTANLKGTTVSFNDLDESLQDDLEIYIKVRLGQMGRECVNNCISWLKGSRWVWPQSKDCYQWTAFIGGLMLTDVYFCAILDNAEEKQSSDSKIEDVPISKTALYDYFEFLFSRLFMHHVDVVFKQPVEKALQISEEEFNSYLPLFQSGVLTYNTLAVNIVDTEVELEKRILYCFNRMLSWDSGEIVDRLINNSFNSLFDKFIQLYAKHCHLPSWVVILMFYPLENEICKVESSYTLSYIFQNHYTSVNLRPEKEDKAKVSGYFESLLINQQCVRGKILEFNHEVHQLIVFVQSIDDTACNKIKWLHHLAQVDNQGTFELSLMENGKNPILNQVLITIIPKTSSNRSIASEPSEEIFRSAVLSLKFTDRQRQVDLVGKWCSRLREHLARKTISSIRLNGNGEVVL